VFSRAARDDTTAGLLGFALFRSWQAGREAEFVERTGRPASDFDPEFLGLVRPEIIDRIVADARAVKKGAALNRAQSYEPDRPNAAARAGRTAVVATAFAACFLALFAFSAVQSVAGVPGLPFEHWKGLDVPAALLAFPGLLLSVVALGYAVRTPPRPRRRKIHWLSR
jgi:hypothetical protein